MKLTKELVQEIGAEIRAHAPERAVISSLEARGDGSSCISYFGLAPHSSDCIRAEASTPEEARAIFTEKISAVLTKSNALRARASKLIEQAEQLESEAEKLEKEAAHA
jgi:hypothetical protein